jgi:hypothetical protein
LSERKKSLRGGRFGSRVPVCTALLFSPEPLLAVLFDVLSSRVKDIEKTEKEIPR